MASALSLVVLGQAYFLGPLSNNPSAIAPNSTLQSQPEPLHGAGHGESIITPSISHHKVHTKPATWNTARKICESEGGYLAIINSVEESDLIAKLFKISGPHPGSDDSNYVHIGFHDLYQEGEYVTIHGDSLTTAGFDVWQEGEPKNGGNVENCGSMFKEGTLNDIWCYKSLGFVCESPFVEEDSIEIAE